MPKCIDSPVKHVETGTADPVVDGVFAQARFFELVPRDHPVLPLRQPGNDSIHRTRGQFTAHTAVN